MTTITLKSSTKKSLGYTRPFLYKQQKEAIFNPARYVIIEASTKSGKTAGCMAWLTEQALLYGKEGRVYWWVAPVYSQAKMVHRRLKRALPRYIFTSNESELSINLDNGSSIICKSGDNADSLYGEDVYGAVIDEATRCREESWFAVRTTLTSTRGHIRIIGNVKGRRNWAYQLARRAEVGQKDWHYAKITAYDAINAGIISDAEVEDARNALPENVFQELYEAKPSDDGGNPFGINAIRECIGELSTEEPAFWGWDLARSEDYTWGIALDSEMKVCRNIRFQKPWTQTINDITSLVGDTPALADATGVGDAVVEDLQRNLPRMEGFKFSAQSKQNLMERLAIAIAGKEIQFPDGMLVSELEAFEYEYTRTGVRYSAPAGIHDDGVIALALAVYHGTHAPTQGVW
tara:strand:- start:1163 stop:2377 length:1215 start_codon:yes stop_codon:yes gene_type:complete